MWGIVGLWEGGNVGMGWTRLLDNLIDNLRGLLVGRRRAEAVMDALEG